MKTKTCLICLKNFPGDKLIAGHGIRHEIESLIQKDYSEWNDSCFLCKADYEKYRKLYIKELIQKEHGEIQSLESEVLQTIEESEIITSKIDKEAEQFEIGERISDKIAEFGGSWKFIIIFLLLLLMWIILNSIVLFFRPFDPYPFILLNLILSCIAAVQAPIIMMSQNRLEAKDRIRSKNDYKINLKAEIEIRTLHEKIDHLLLEQWSKMIEIQQLEIDLLNEINEKLDSGNNLSG